MKTLFFFLTIIVTFDTFSQEIEDKGNGIKYKTVTIGDQTWMAENLNVSKFQNGDKIFKAKNKKEWLRLQEEGKPAWCYYEFKRKNGRKYGKLYNGSAVLDSRGLAPKGWYVPSNKDWDKLINFLGGEEIAGEKMKSAKLWKENGGGTHESGFNALPGGYVRTSLIETKPLFCSTGEEVCFWTNDEVVTELGGDRSLNYESSFVFSDYSPDFMYVRCIKDK